MGAWCMDGCSNILRASAALDEQENGKRTKGRMDTAEGDKAIERMGTVNSSNHISPHDNFAQGQFC